jgi:hypothetical protein
MSDVRQAALNSIGNMGAILMAAGQRMQPEQRAAYLAQLGQAGGNFNTDIYNASQRRLMAARTEEQRREIEENKRITEEMKDAAGFKAKYGFDPTGFGAGDVRAAVKQINVNRMSRDPETVRRTRLENESLERAAEAERLAGQYLAQRTGAAPAGVAAPLASGAPVGSPVGAPTAAPAMPGAPSMPRSAATYQIPNNIVQSLLAGGVKPREIIKMEAEGALKQDTWIAVPPGENEIRKGYGLSPTQPAKMKLDAMGNVVDWQIQGEDPNKAPSGFEWETTAGQRRLRPIAGGPQEQIAAEVGARVGLAESFKPYAKSIREALDTGKFDLSNVPNRASLAIGVGEMGALSRRMNVGKEALVRGLTGAGMNVSEAETYANQYGIGATDSPDTIRDKLNMMEWSLDNVKAIVTRGRGELSPIGSGPAPFGSKATGNDAAAAPKVRRYNPATGKIED